jgi:hypothetical protein
MLHAKKVWVSPDLKSLDIQDTLSGPFVFATETIDLNGAFVGGPAGS